MDQPLQIRVARRCQLKQLIAAINGWLVEDETLVGHLVLAHTLDPAPFENTEITGNDLHYIPGFTGVENEPYGRPPNTAAQRTGFARR